MCTDYRKVNNLSKTDTFPIPRMDDCIDKIGNSKYITKFDLLKGFWQIPLTERAKEISAFVTPDGLYHYKVMPFGMKNSPATFQRLINTIIAGIEHCEAYIDDAIIYNDEWNLGTIEVFFDKLKAILRSEPVLLAPNFNKEFKLAVDASDVGAGGVLLQEYDNGVDHPVCYFSKKFNKHQKNYSTVEKECLSLILALQHFEVYLTSSSSPIFVFSDHNPLTFIHKMKNKNQKLLRWSLLLQEYNLDIRHIRGKDNIIPDALSRA